jgi:hypothetical protein
LEREERILKEQQQQPRLASAAGAAINQKSMGLLLFASYHMERTHCLTTNETRDHRASFIITSFLEVLLSYHIVLNTRGIQHDTHTSSNGLRRKIATEAATNNAIGSVRTADLSPCDTKLVSKFISSRSLSDKGHLLSAVKLCILSRINSLDLD